MSPAPADSCFEGHSHLRDVVVTRLQNCNDAGPFGPSNRNRQREHVWPLVKAVDVLTAERSLLNVSGYLTDLEMRTFNDMPQSQAIFLHGEAVDVD